MTTDTDGNETQTTDGPDAGTQSLEQIREILFGNQSRNIDDRLQSLHDQLFDAVGNLRSLMTERTDALNHKLEQEIRTLHDELGNHRREQHERNESLDQKFSNANNDLRQQIGALRETFAGTEKSIREDMNQGFEELKNSLLGQMEEIRTTIQRDLSQLSQATVSRRSLSDALKQLSSQFEQE